MSNKTKEYSRRSMPILSILTLIFVTLKLAEIGMVATWSWWLVLLPLYLVPAIGLTLIISTGLICSLIGITLVAIDKLERRQKRRNTKRS